MNMDYVAAVGLVIIIVSAVVARQWAKDPDNECLQAIYEQFRQLRQDNPAQLALAYDGRTAAVVHDYVEVHQQKRYEPLQQTLHRVFRNEHREYFLFISSDPAARPFVTHLSRQRAMNALRGDAVAFRREFGDEPGA